MSGTTTSVDPTTLPGDNSVSGGAPGGGGNSNTSAGGSTSGFSLPLLPPQYATGNLGFFTRQTESVTDAITVGPDGALYVGVLTATPYPAGYSNVWRIADPKATTGYDGKISSGVPQAYASGFSEAHSLGFDTAGNLYVLEYLNANTVYDPTIAPGDLPPSQLIKVAPDGSRNTISGPELKLGNYLLVDKASGDVFVAINNADTPNGEVLRYHTDPATGAVSHTVAASGLNNPRGMAFGPDGKLYVLESGLGTPSSSPDAATAPVIPFIPGLVSERGGNTGSITSVDVNGTGAQNRVLTGLPSLREFNPATGEDRVLSIGPNALAITPEGTAFIAAGGGLAPETAQALGPIGDKLKGVLRVDGLFGADPSEATVTPAFDTLAYAAQNGPDGETTLFNTESNLYDITVGEDGKLYAVDAARNLVYGFTNNGTTLDSVTVLQKQPPVLTPPQYAAVVGAGGDPSAQYAAEIENRTFKNADGVPDVPGNVAVPPGTTAGPPGASGTTLATVSATNSAGGAGAPGADTPPAGSGALPPGINAPPGELPSGSSSALPVPTDPVSPPVLANNIYTNYYDPFFGNFAPAAAEPLALPNGHGGTYTASQVYSFGDRLSDTGNTAALEKFLGKPTPLTTAPYSTTGSFSDGPNWTTDLSQILGVQPSASQTNFAYETATARPLDNFLDPNPSQTGLSTFDGQISRFQETGGAFSPNDLVTVGFGDYDLTVPSDVPPEEGVKLSVDAITAGLQRLADLGARHFLVANLRFVALSPAVTDPNVNPASAKALYDQFNAQLSASLEQYKASTGLDVKELDLNSLFNNIAAKPSDYGFTNVSEPLLTNATVPGTVPAYNPAIVGQDPAVEHSTLFLNPFYDTTALGQAVIAQTARSTLSA